MRRYLKQNPGHHLTITSGYQSLIITVMTNLKQLSENHLTVCLLIHEVDLAGQAAQVNFSSLLIASLHRPHRATCDALWQTHLCLLEPPNKIKSICRTQNSQTHKF